MHSLDSPGERQGQLVRSFGVQDCVPALGTGLTQPRRKCPKQQHGKNKPREDVRYKLRYEPDTFQELSQCLDAIPSEVPGLDVFVRPKRRHGWDRAVEPPAWFQYTAHFRQESGFILDVLENIKSTKRRDRSCSEHRIVQSCPNNLFHAALQRVERTLSRLDQDHVDAGLLQSLCHKPIAPTNVVKPATRRELPQNFNDALVTVVKPVARFFDLQAGFIPVFRVLNR